MPFQRGTATDYRDLLDKLDKFMTHDHIDTVAINAGGTGHAVGDLLSVVGGTVVGSMTARIEVLAVSGGIITSVRLFDAGAYSADPSLTANAVTSDGAGINATMDLTMLGGNSYLSAVAVNAGGTGYVVDNILSVVGGTTVGGKVATIRVTAESSGVITAVSVEDAGTYSADPSTTANAVTGGDGSGATMDLTMQVSEWVPRITNIAAATGPIVIGAGDIAVDGTGYTQNDIITMADTVSSTSKGQFKVTTVSGGGDVLTIDLEDPGDYNTFTGGSFATTGGTGTGLTIDPLFRPTRDEYLWEGVGTGGNEVFVGIRSGFNGVDDQVLWELAGFTGWNGGSDWEAQAGISPGRNDLINTFGLVILLSTNPMTFWFAANTRRIVVVVNVSGNYQSAYLGLLDPYGTDSEIPYPLHICGTTDSFSEDIGSLEISTRGIVDPAASSTSASAGPGRFRDGGGTWNKVNNGRNNGTTISTSRVTGYFIYPCSQLAVSGLLDADDFVSQATPFWEDMIPSNRTGVPIRILKPSPDAGGDLYLPIPAILARSEGAGTHKIIGELVGVNWVSAEDGLTTEDKITVGGDVFRVFQMGSHSLSFAHFCIKEE